MKKANMKNLLMPIIIGIICCMLFGYVDKGHKEIENYQEVASYQSIGSKQSY